VRIPQVRDLMSPLLLVLLVILALAFIGGFVLTKLLWIVAVAALSLVALRFLYR
jgi:hypothetical protein